MVDSIVNNETKDREAFQTFLNQITKLGNTPKDYLLQIKELAELGFLTLYGSYPKSEITEEEIQEEYVVS